MATTPNIGFGLAGTSQVYKMDLASYQAFSTQGNPIRSGCIIVDPTTTPHTVLGISDGAGGFTGGLTPAQVAQVQSLVSGGQIQSQFWLATGLGDSITQGDGGYTDETSFTASSNTLFEWICRLSGGRIIRRRNAGVAGQTSAQILARFATDVPPETSMLIIHAGTNDPGTLTEDQTVTNVQAMVTTALALSAMRSIVICGLPPKNTAPTAIQSINRRFAALARTSGGIVRYIAPWERFRAGDGTYASGASADGVHPTAATALTGASDWLTQFFGATVQETPFLLPTENADPKSCLYFGSTPNSCFMTDSNSDGTPDGWGSSTEITNTLPAATFPAIGKSLVMTATAVTTTRTVQRSTPSNALTGGARYVAVCRVSASGFVAGGARWKIGVIASGITVALNNFAQIDGNFVLIVPFTASSAPSTTYFQVNLQPVGGSGAGVLTLSQADIFLTSDLGVTL